MSYINIKTGDKRTVLPTTKIREDGSPIQGATLKDWSVDGWREIVGFDPAPEGTRVTAYTPEEIEGTLTCIMRVKSYVNIAAEQAQIEAAAIAAEQNRIEMEQAMKLQEGDFALWSKQLRFLMAVIQGQHPAIDYKAEWKKFNK